MYRHRLSEVQRITTLLSNASIGGIKTLYGLSKTQGLRCMNIFRTHDDKQSKKELVELRFPKDLIFVEGYTVDAVDIIQDKFGYLRIDILFKKENDVQHLTFKIGSDGDRMIVENNSAFLKKFYNEVKNELHR
jgi:hypothetical protein